MTSRTVLLIDGDADSLHIYSAILEHFGFRVLCASEGDAGFQLALESQPSAIVLEPFTRSVSGRSVAAVLREEPRTAAIPVVVLTSMPGRLAALRLGAGYERPLAKPLPPRHLVSEVQQLLNPLSVAV